MMKAKMLLLSLVVLPTSFAYAISHGTKVGPEIHPEALSIKNIGCSGVAISPHVFLTAGHCLLKKNNAILQVGEQQFESKKIFVHPTYLKNISKEVSERITRVNDIAVIVFDTDIFPVHAHLKKAPPMTGSLVEFIGFGPAGSMAFFSKELLDQFQRDLNIDVFAIAEQTKRLGRNRYQSLPESPGVIGLKSVAVSPISKPHQHRSIEKTVSGFTGGDSGGPVYDEDGQLIGIISGHMWSNDQSVSQEAIDLNFAAMISNAENWEFLSNFVEQGK